jgi:hypothetical protein
MASKQGLWLASLAISLNLSCNSSEPSKPVQQEIPVSISAATASIGGLKLGMSKEQVQASKGKPVTVIKTKVPNEEVWDYEDLSVTFEGAKAGQIVGGQSLLIDGRELAWGVKLDEFSAQTGIPLESLPSSSSKMIKSIPVQGGALSIGQSGGKIRTYGLSIK